MNTLFSEASREWQPVPSWVDFLIRLGYGWPAGVAAPRRIALVSMPCDSAAAGLIALGALVRDLGSSDANDVGGHFDSLIRYARQYLESCGYCQVRCHPELRSCGHAAEANGQIRSLLRPFRGYQVSGFTDAAGERQIEFYRARDGVTIKLPPPGATKYYIASEPPPDIGSWCDPLPEKTYAEIIEGAEINPDNLRRSFSGLCLAGRIAGETASREACASVRLRCADGEHCLSDLLTIRGWCPSNAVSRVTFFNARTELHDRYATATALVVADGDAPFLRTLNRQEFQRSDVIGVVHRVVERDRLEALGNQMLGLRQWYAEDTEMLGSLPAAPRGIGVSILKRRTP